MVIFGNGTVVKMYVVDLFKKC